MKKKGYVLVAALAAAIVSCGTTETRDGGAMRASVQHRVDPFWPKPLQGNWILGQVSGIAVDSRDHVKGNLYTAEVGNGRRVQKFVPVEPAPVSTPRHEGGGMSG